MSYAIIKRAFDAAHDPMQPQDHTQPIEERIQEFARQFAGDRRLTVKWINASCATNSIHSATVKFKGRKWFLHSVPGPIRTGPLARQVFIGWGV